MNRILTLLFLIIFAPGLLSQSLNRDMELQLENQFLRLRSGVSSDRKFKINDSIARSIGIFASGSSAFRQNLTNLKYLGQITSPDSLVKIITWNLIPGDGHNYYYCYLLHRESKNTAPALIKLTATHKALPVRTDTSYSAADWYGALYYDIRPFESGGMTRYLALGIDYGASLTTRKMIEVITFSHSGNVIFGAPCFANGSETTHRVVFEYAASAVMSLKFESDHSIVFDHLSPFSPEMKGNYQFYGPDFSFDSYDFDKGLWRYRSDIDIRNKE